ncbi:MAG: hypothetical protein CFE62_001435 [Candidatus Aquirickettsiella gammari]|uniref:Inverse autotransporter beta-domain domain-containing protein n=1 Tax=Candidatus Aquirickettsiella gammari TaxID=2016198 RepID=A0A370CIZ5_9COXI|nr:MAG: hypothetical protein CFE62_001435 [Candidatus Aquirickettsiella gammari]
MPREKQVFKLKLLSLALLSCCAWSASALAGDYLPPRLSVDANAGGSATVGQADLLLSLKGDERRNLYLDPQAAYGTDEQWYADLGLGYRWIQNDAAILGGYVFASRSQVANQSGFWIANPGVEALGSRWDARINGYIPVGGRSDDLGIVQFNQSSRFVFSGHTERRVTTYLTGDETQQIGDGVDAKVGYQVFRNVPLKAYLGAYFFNISNADNVRGGAAGVEYWFDQHVKAFVNYTYDNLQYNTVVGGLAVSFGGVDEARADPSLSERLTDPVERYLANLGHGSGIPSDTELTNLRTGRRSALNNRGTGSGGEESESELLDSDVAYFSQTGTPNNGGVGLSLANCTFENPCGPTDFSQTGVNTLNSLLPNTLMFFNGGTYNALDATGSNPITLNSGQGVNARTADYSQAATGSGRSVFNGAFILNTNNTLANIILLPTAATASGTGVTDNNGTNGFIRGSQIGNVNNLYNVGVVISTNQLTITNSVIFGNNRGIRADSGSVLFIQGSQINTISPSGGTTGISASNSNIILNDTQINVTAPGSASGNVIGINALSGSTVTINGSNTAITSSLTGTRGSSIALTTDESSEQEMQGGILSVSGAGTTTVPTQGSVVLNSVTCITNGITGAC